jgi:hypothetical protein
MAGRGGSRRTLGTRLLWFAGLWLAGVLAVGAVAFLIRSTLL